MVFCVEILAIYELPGANVSAARRNQRDSDFALVQTRAGQVGHTVPPQTNEYLDTFDANRYGFGWRAKQWISTQADATTVGEALWTRLVTRNLQAGSKVEVFALDETQPGYVTSDALYRRRVPPQGDDIG